MSRGERGSALVLVPAGVLVLVVLGAIAVDSAVAFLGQREASNAAAAAANDAAAAALSDASFYRGSGALVVDPVRADAVARRAVEARAPRGLAVEAVEVRVDGAGVCVTVRGRVPYVFARGLPFAADSAVVRGQAGAVAASGNPGAGGAVAGSPC